MRRTPFLVLLSIFALLSLQSTTVQAKNTIDLEAESIDFTKFSQPIQTRYLDQQSTRLSTYTNDTQKCPRLDRLVTRIMRRLVIFSELSQKFDVEKSQGLKSLELRMACQGQPERRQTRLEYGVLNFGIELLPLIKSEDQLAAMIALELGKLVRAQDLRVIELDLPYFMIGRADRVAALKRKIQLEADASALAILVNAGYDGYALIDFIELARQYRRDQQTTNVVDDKFEVQKRRQELQTILISNHLQPARQNTADSEAIAQELEVIARTDR